MMNLKVCHVTLVQAVSRYSPGRFMAQAISCRPLTEEAWVRSRASQYGTCGGQIDSGTGFSQSYSGFPCQYLPTVTPDAHALSGGITNRPVDGSSSETSPHPIEMNSLSKVQSKYSHLWREENCRNVGPYSRSLSRDSNIPSSNQVCQPLDHEF
jgi:hypothetical protein